MWKASPIIGLPKMTAHLLVIDHVASVDPRVDKPVLIKLVRKEEVDGNDRHDGNVKRPAALYRKRDGPDKAARFGLCVINRCGAELIRFRSQQLSLE